MAQSAGVSNSVNLDCGLPRGFGKAGRGERLAPVPRRAPGHSKRHTPCSMLPIKVALHTATHPGQHSAHLDDGGKAVEEVLVVQPLRVQRGHQRRHVGRRQRRQPGRGGGGPGLRGVEEGGGGRSGSGAGRARAAHGMQAPGRRGRARNLPPRQAPLTSPLRAPSWPSPTKRDASYKPAHNCTHSTSPASPNSRPRSALTSPLRPPRSWPSPPCRRSRCR